MTVSSVVFLRRASKDVERIDVWWRQHRQSAPDLFLTEVGRALALIATTPALGVAARSHRLPGVRRVLLERTRYHLYFRAVGPTIEVLAVWHSSRRTGPIV
jgi:plasmid stabilization system protein ParE